MVDQRRPDYSCRDCGANIDDIDEYNYMVKDEVWKAATRRAQQALGPGQASVDDMLCIGCLEYRIGRLLYKHDFNWHVPLTTDRSRPRSPRLLDRMQRSVASLM